MPGLAVIRGGPDRAVGLRVVPVARVAGKRDHRFMGVTVVIVDDHEGFRVMARQLLEDQGFDVVGDASDGEQALAAIQALRPELVLLDVQLPDMDGFTVARRLAASHPETAVVLTSVRPGSDYGDRLPRAAARGFVPKAELSGTILLEMMAERR